MEHDKLLNENDPELSRLSIIFRDIIRLIDF
jgi:hypothetical protein